jgi:hypothetical protein
MTVFPAAGGFYQLSGLPAVVQKWLRYDIPVDYRYYSDSGTKGPGSWYVHEKYLLGVIELSYKQLGTVDYSCLPDYLQIEIAKEKKHWTVNQNKSISYSKSSSLKDAYERLYLLPTAPISVVRSVWRGLARLSHPDQGGDEEQFKQYKEAYDLINKEAK